MTETLLNFDASELAEYDVPDKNVTWLIKNFGEEVLADLVNEVYRQRGIDHLKYHFLNKVAQPVNVRELFTAHHTWAEYDNWQRIQTIKSRRDWSMLHEQLWNAYTNRDNSIYNEYVPTRLFADYLQTSMGLIDTTKDKRRKIWK